MARAGGVNGHCAVRHGRRYGRASRCSTDCRRSREKRERLSIVPFYVYGKCPGLRAAPGLCVVPRFCITSRLHVASELLALVACCGVASLLPPCSYVRFSSFRRWLHRNRPHVVRPLRFASLLWPLVVMPARPSANRGCRTSTATCRTSGRRVMPPLHRC